MQLVVWVREIADTRDLVGDVLDGSGAPRWGQWESRMDPEDLNALEMALQIKDKQAECKVTAVTVGSPRKLDVLRECLYRGVDEVVRLAGQDGGEGLLGEARRVAAAMRRMGTVDLLFTGVQLNEGDTAQKGILTARMLAWPAVSYVEAMEGLEPDRVRLRRAIEGGVQVVEARLPVVASVGVALLKDDPRAPRSAKAKLKLQYKRTPIVEWGDGDLGLEAGDRAASVRVMGYRALQQRAFPSRRIDGADAAQLQAMLAELRSQGLLR